MKFKLLIFIFVSALCVACKKNIGMMASENRPAGAIKKIIIDHKINLTLTQDSVEKIVVIAGENIISSIGTLVKDSVLIIENINNSSINDPGTNIEVKVSVRDLQLVEYKGSGNIKSTNTLRPSAFTIVSSKGAGIINLNIETGHLVAGIYEENADMIFSGKSNTAFVYCSSRGTIDMKNMQVKKMNIIYSSVRNGYVWVTESLAGSIYHTGNVFYKGMPTLDVKQLSTGRFLQL
jgi:hypothetical protein